MDRASKSNRRKKMPPTYLLGAMVLMAALHFLLPLARMLRWPLCAVGLTPLAAGVILNLWADRDFKRIGNPVKPFEESTGLITDGTFRVSRHPMYLGMALILLGMALLMGSVGALLPVPLFLLVMEKAFVVEEERMLARQFGDYWKRYRAGTRRWL
ncbi:DUF1295 domain-containing protein [Candidatus Fermentibacteria bacterium]|nr:DUF1295 domain-containing protein [Candidatus Fermentibacteria bacterium]